MKRQEDGISHAAGKWSPGLGTQERHVARVMNLGWQIMTAGMITNRSSSNSATHIVAKQGQVTNRRDGMGTYNMPVTVEVCCRRIKVHIT